MQQQFQWIIVNQYISKQQNDLSYHVLQKQTQK